MNIIKKRLLKSAAKLDIRTMNVAKAKKLKDKGYSNAAIGRKIGRSESTVRRLLSEDDTLA